jgi:hypothetical protein
MHVKIPNFKVQHILQLPLICILNLQCFTLYFGMCVHPIPVISPDVYLVNFFRLVD